MELAEPTDTIISVSITISQTMTITYRWGRAMVCRIVIVCVDVWWILHFILHNHRLRDAFLEVAS